MQFTLFSLTNVFSLLLRLYSDYVSLYTVIVAIVLFKLNLESLEIVMELNTTVLFMLSYFIVVQGCIAFVVSCTLWLVYMLSLTGYFYFHVSLDCIFLVYVLLSGSFFDLTASFCDCVLSCNCVGSYKLKNYKLPEISLLNKS